MIKSKKVVGAILAGVMTLTSVGSSINSINNIAVVEAAGKDNAKAVHNKVEHLIRSIKKNYLGIKNVEQWKKYIQEARNLNERLPKGSSKNKYAERINKAEAVVNAAASVNQLEISMQKIAPTKSNFAQWITYLILAAIDVEKIDKVEYPNEYKNLESRTEAKAYELEALASKLGLEKNDVKEAIDIEASKSSNIK